MAVNISLGSNHIYLSSNFLWIYDRVDKAYFFALNKVHDLL